MTAQAMSGTEGNLPRAFICSTRVRCTAKHKSFKILINENSTERR